MTKMAMDQGMNKCEGKMTKCFGLLSEIAGK